MGDFYQVIGAHPKAPTVSIVMGLSNDVLFEYRENLTRIGDNFNSALSIVKEHVEPRTKDVWAVLVEDEQGLSVITCWNKEELSNVKQSDETILSIKKVPMIEGEMDE